jgi:hypothetical protein
MKNAAITQTITHYLAKNFESLEGAMPNENYFLIRGASTDEHSYDEPRIAIGTAIDILADTIEKRKFFGYFISEEVSSADASGNAGLQLLRTGDDIHGKFEIKLLENGLFVAAERIDKKDYLNVLRTSEGFKQAAELLGIEKNLEKIASTIYEN